MRDGEPLTERLLADLGEMIRVGDYSQSTVANALGVPRQRVSEWLKGAAKPSLETGLAIAEHVRLWEISKASRRQWFWNRWIGILSGGRRDLWAAATPERGAVS
jgi:DNA-binding XRE family transcriptional regulator